jgi:hypothetical protein
VYTKNEYRSVEPVCYEDEHINKVVKKLRQNFTLYFDRFLETENGNGITKVEFEKLQKSWGVKSSNKVVKSDLTKKYKRILAESIDEFEKDREAYIDIFNMKSLEEYEDDTYTFKSEVLHNKCPIIRKTLANKKAKELDKYRYDFSVADADKLLEVVKRLCEVADDYAVNVYNRKEYEKISNYKGLKMAEFDTDECTAYGVIGGGIKTHMLYKVNPEMFSSRSRNALWALWYMTDKESFGCYTDSEFLMIDTKKTITQQNYFYPYELFAYYAFEVYKLLRDKAENMGVSIDTKYRYVIVDKFFDYVADEHADEIGLLHSQIRDNVGDAYA